MKTRLARFKTFPALSSHSGLRVAFYDSKLPQLVPGFSKWLRAFDFAVELPAGESLKSTRELERVVGQLFSSGHSFSRDGTQFFAIGGGSVGDFVGFLASTFLRGVELLQVPTTWLSAMDSAHGGKTALNVAGTKNVLGTFYPASEVWLIEPFFKHQSGARVNEALGEAAKMALLDTRVARAAQSLHASESEWTLAELWKLLPSIIEAKMRVVNRDPFEKRGDRRVLNLGHTLGHVLESRFKIPHGLAVGYGLHFALWVSWCEGVLPAKKFFELERSLSRDWGLDIEAPRKLKLSREDARRLLLRDKKVLSAGSLQFIAIRGVGRPVQLPLKVDLLLDALEEFWT